MTRLNSLESLRGLLALWVVIGHVLRPIYVDDHPAFLNILLTPVLAVDVFIILSGFVIFFLLDKSSPSYRDFVIGRWFRLAPVYFFTLLVSTVTLTGQTELLRVWPIQNSSVLMDMKLHDNSLANIKTHFLAHLTLLHGLIPDSLLPSSQFAIVGVAWSISVEWQFYLVAPLIFILIRGPNWYAVCFLVIAISAAKVAGFGNMGSLVQHAHLFIIGIGSYYLWKYSNNAKVDGRLLDTVTVLAIVLALFIASRSLSLAIWFFAMNLILASRQGATSTIQRLALKFMESKPLLFLGRISYSMYLLHMLVFYAVATVATSHVLLLPKSVFAGIVVLAVVAISICLSAITYKYIEQPGINAGRRLISWLAKRESLIDSPSRTI